MQPFEDLKVWQRSHRLALLTYRFTTNFPREERFGLISQMRRAAVSVPCNIAEGSRREYARDYARFVNIAECSGAELKYLTILSRDLAFLDAAVAGEVLKESDQIARMLYGLRRRIGGTRALAED
jgi:four helix bundle protein